ncbi:hypothetical protein PQQ32_08010 [Brachyspira hyodysenteriae]|uniref:hypothetical protein n=1 Tax=Brachyspira hyodysenteriae TaxID=159 RepID=UPI002B25D0EB|nr:hypothetical protein [Brachyspira hyodysenteriae]WPC36827.1 hypothetical protein PQQ32_08010 [Brachyspira hyodysenteriae]
MKKIINIIISHIILFVIIYTIISVLSNFNIVDISDVTDVNNVIFTSIGIMFSIGFTIILSFNLENINNEYGFNFIKENLTRISFFSLTLFILSLIVFMLSKILNIKTLNDYEKIKHINSISLSLLFIFLVSLACNYKRLFDIKFQIMKRIFNERNKNNLEIKTKEIIEKNDKRKNKK